jgi:hypothetical protein
LKTALVHFSSLLNPVEACRPIVVEAAAVIVMAVAIQTVVEGMTLDVPPMSTIPEIDPGREMLLMIEKALDTVDPVTVVASPPTADPMQGIRQVMRTLRLMHPRAEVEDLDAVVAAVVDSEDEEVVVDVRPLL